MQMLTEEILSPYSINQDRRIIGVVPISDFYINGEANPHSFVRVRRHREVLMDLRDVQGDSFALGEA
jgi:hypothetical protein